MIKRAGWLVAGLLLLGVAAGAGAANDPTVVGRVVGIVTGDTVTFETVDRRRFEVRLAGIAAPARLQPFGEQSRSALGARVFGREVELAGAQRGGGRVVARLLVAAPGCNSADCARNRDPGLDQLADGMAWWHPPQAGRLTTDERAGYASAELAAKLQRQGLWSAKNPVPPWAWPPR